MTHRIYKALINHPDDIIDDNGRIMINDISKWLQNEAEQHNKSNPIKVPIPSLKGSDRVNFEVAIVQKKNRRSAASQVDAQLLGELDEWKGIHTEMQRLADDLMTIIRFLDMSWSLNDEMLEKQLYMIERSWANFTIKERDLCFIIGGLKYASTKDLINEDVARLHDLALIISKSIRTARTTRDIKVIQKNVNSINEDIQTMLRVSDHQVVRIINILNQKSSGETHLGFGARR